MRIAVSAKKKSSVHAFSIEDKLKEGSLELGYICKERIFKPL